MTGFFYERMYMISIPFPIFATMWNQLQGLKTPRVHYKIILWLEACWEQENKRMLLMAFRSCGKSTMVGLFCAWLIFRNPDIRILVLAADTNLAKKMVRNVKRIIERHPLTAHLKPNKPDQWASEYFTVRRKTELRDPSMLARGITSNITGLRADLIICDDVEVPNTCDTAEKRKDLRVRLSEMEYVLVSGGAKLFVGTPHTYHSIYNDKPQIELGEQDEFLYDYKRLRIPIYNLNQEIAWPEKYSRHDIKMMKKQTGPAKFKSQMLLEPVNIQECRLDSKNLHIYEDNIDYSEAGHQPVLKIGDQKMISASAWWDPSFGASHSDGSVLACLFVDEEGHFYLHNLTMITKDWDGAGDDDPASIQCRKVSQILAQNYMPNVNIETNGIGKFLPAILKNELAKIGHRCAVQEITSRTNKDQRILEAFDVVLAARLLHVHKSVLQTPFITEMQEWHPGKSKGHDDTLDAVAGAINQEPVRIRRLIGSSPKKGWSKNATHYKAKTYLDGG